MAQHNTYTTWILKSLMAAEGWHAAYYDNGTHIYDTIHAIALAYPRFYDKATRKEVPSLSVYALPQDELWQLVGLTYSLSDRDFHVCDDARNFCGLLPPETNMETFDTTCHHSWQGRAEPPSPDSH